MFLPSICHLQRLLMFICQKLFKIWTSNIFLFISLPTGIDIHLFQVDDCIKFLFLQSCLEY